MIKISGGHFNYDQHRIGYIADEIEELIRNNDNQELDQWGSKKGCGFSTKTIKMFREAVTTLREAQIMAHRIDWLVSGDDDEVSFYSRWDEDLEKLNYE